MGTVMGNDRSVDAREWDPPKNTLERQTVSAVTVSEPVVWLSTLVAVLALVAAGLGVFWTDGPGTEVVETVRGETVELHGKGPYRYDSVFKAAGHRGSDTATLIFGIPLLALAAVLYRRGSVKGALLLSGMLTYFLYVYASLALGAAAYNRLFLLYVAVYSSSLFGLIALLKSSWRLADRFSDAPPRSRIAALMFTCGVVTAVVWVVPLVGAMIEGGPPALLDHYSTMVTEALDVGVIVPAVFLSGVLILRRDGAGYMIAVPLLILLAMLLPAISGQTAYQLSASIELTPPEIVGPVGGFLVLGSFAVWTVVILLRDASRAGAASR